MPETMTLSSTIVTGNNDTFTDLISVTGASIERTTPSIPAAKTGTLTTRTDANTGSLTMSASHGITDGQLLDVFWSSGSRRGMTVGTVSTNVVPIDGGSGDDLPIATTAITAMVPVAVEFVVDGDTVLGFGVTSAAIGYIVFIDDAAAVIAAATYKITTAGYGKVWATGSPGTNPLAGDVTSLVKFSHGQTTAQVMKACAVFGTPPS